MANILLIEPDRLLAEIYRKALSGAGHTVEVCASAQAAVLVADQVQPQIVILELQLTTHSGIEFLYEFRSYPDWQDIPVIVHSQVPATEFESNQLLKRQLGITDYLYKPQTSLEELLKAVDKYLPVTPA